MGNVVKSVVINDDFLDALRVACSALNNEKRDCLDMIELIGKTSSPVDDSLVTMYLEDIDRLEKANRLFWDIILSNV